MRYKSKMVNRHAALTDRIVFFSRIIVGLRVRINGEKKTPSDKEMLRIYLLNVRVQFQLEAVLEGEERNAFDARPLDSTRTIE